MASASEMAMPPGVAILLAPMACLSTTVRAALAGRTSTICSACPPVMLSRSSLAASASVSMECTSWVAATTPAAMVSSEAAMPVSLRIASREDFRMDMATPGASDELQ